MVNNSAVKITVLAVMWSLQGCSFLSLGKSEYDCPGGVNGVRCMSARQVYQATETSDYVKTKEEMAESPSNGNPVSPGKANTGQVAVPRINQPVPIRTQAKVMRIWMSPWEDEDGDLHADGYMYTEIESRRWNLGDKFKAPGNEISPLSSIAPQKNRK
jgi:conjugal transfer pilus assembly protein TraV